MATKHCNFCDTTKPLDDFPRNAKGTQGRSHRCRVCTASYNADYAKRQKARQKDVPAQKRCSACQVVKPAGAFYRASRFPDGLAGYCKACKQDRRRQDEYGLTSEQYQELLAAQDGRCAICQEEKPLHVDHCHRGGQVRALLCGSCNRALGLFQDDPVRLRAAISYLTSNL